MFFRLKSPRFLIAKTLMKMKTRTRTFSKETTLARRLDRDRMACLAAILAPVVLYIPVAFSDGAWRVDSAAFWWGSWALLCMVCDNAKRIEHLCAESHHLQSFTARVMKTGAMKSLAVTALLCIVIGIFVHMPVPRRIVGVPIPAFLLVFSVCQDRLLRRLTKIEQL